MTRACEPQTQRPLLPRRVRYFAACRGTTSRLAGARVVLNFEFYAGWMLDLDAIDVNEIATALADQTDYEHRWLIDPGTGELAFWTSDLGIDGDNPVELDELDLILIDPLPSHVWYQDMVDFAEGISNRGAGERLSRSLVGKGRVPALQERALPRTPRADHTLARPA